MNVQKLLIFAFLLSTTACSAQKKQGKTMDIIEIVKAQKGNTGFRGRMPKEDVNKPNQGKDYYLIQIKVNKDCTINLLNFYIHKGKQNGENTADILSLENLESKKQFKAIKGEIYTLRANYDATPEEGRFKGVYPLGSGRLELKVGSEFISHNILKFEEILPN
jgi:hypothetical protein